MIHMPFCHSTTVTESGYNVYDYKYSVVFCVAHDLYAYSMKSIEEPDCHKQCAFYSWVSISNTGSSDTVRVCYVKRLLFLAHGTF